MDTADINALEALLRVTADQLRADADAPAGSLHTIELKVAAFAAGISEPQMRRRCEKNVYGVAPGGYGQKCSNRWKIVYAPFIATLSVSALRRVKGA